MGSRPLQKYQGSCHCGAVRFEIETDFPELTMCDCSLCRRKLLRERNALPSVGVEGAPRRSRCHNQIARALIHVMPNPSIERTATGVSASCAHGCRSLPIAQSSQST